MHEQFYASNVESCEIAIPYRIKTTEAGGKRDWEREKESLAESK